MDRRRRTAATAAALLALVLAGCEDQDAVPTSTTVPTAALQLAVVLGGVAALVVACRKWAARRAAPPPPSHVGLRRTGAAIAVLVALAALVPFAYGAHGVAVGYREPVSSPFSWREWVDVTWAVGALGGLLSALHLRLASALLAGRRWVGPVVAVDGLLALWAVGAGVAGAA